MGVLASFAFLFCVWCFWVVVTPNKPNTNWRQRSIRQCFKNFFFVLNDLKSVKTGHPLYGETPTAIIAERKTLTRYQKLRVNAVCRACLRGNWSARWGVLPLTPVSRFIESYQPRSVRHPFTKTGVLFESPSRICSVNKQLEKSLGLLPLWNARGKDSNMAAFDESDTCCFQEFMIDTASRFHAGKWNLLQGLNFPNLWESIFEMPKYPQMAASNKNGRLSVFFKELLLESCLWLYSW